MRFNVVMIYKFIPLLKPMMWGGTKIAAYKHIAGSNECIGESWELSALEGQETVVADGPHKGRKISELVAELREDFVGAKVYQRFGNRFPLLIKLIDAHKTLSVQVHPDNVMARSHHGGYGKAEMWYIVEAEPSAKIYAGLTRDITSDEYTELVNQKRIMDVVGRFESVPGDVYFIPPGQIHAIGAGNFLIEIQQSSNITYRVYDFDRRDSNGNARELHTELAREAIHYQDLKSCHASYDRNAEQAVLVDDSRFTVSRVKVDGETAIDMPQGSFLILIVAEGSCSVSTDDGSTAEAATYDTLLIGATASKVTLTGRATILTAHC